MSERRGATRDSGTRGWLLRRWRCRLLSPGRPARLLKEEQIKTLVRSAAPAALVAAALLLYGGGKASDPLAVAAAEAATRCPDGFTVKVHGLPAGSAPTSSVSPTCELDLGIPGGATGAPGPTGTPGKNGFSGWVLTTTVKSSKSNSSERLAAVATCPAGKKAIGGGASITAGRGAIYTIMTSGPTPNGQGWLVSVGKTKYNEKTNESSKSNSNEKKKERLKVTAICAVVG